MPRSWNPRLQYWNHIYRLIFKIIGGLCCEGRRQQLFPPHLQSWRVPKTMATLTPTASLRVQKITLRFDSSLEGLTELTESCYTHSCSLLQRKDTDSKQPREEAYRAAVWRGPCSELLGILSPWNHGGPWLLLAIVWDSTPGVVPPGETHSSLGV